MHWSQYKLFLLLFITLTLGCGTPKNIPSGWQKHTVGDVCLYTPKGFIQGPDKKSLIKGEMVILIEEGRSVNLPSSLEESFIKSFNAYHYNKFFDQVLMDPKVKKLFRDSITLVDIYPIKDAESISCKNCNVLAKIKFKKKVFDFPAQMSEKEINDHVCFKPLTESNDRYEKIIYKPNLGCAPIFVWIHNKNSSFTIIIPSRSIEKPGLLNHNSMPIARSVRL